LRHHDSLSVSISNLYKKRCTPAYLHYESDLFRSSSKDNAPLNMAKVDALPQVTLTDFVMSGSKSSRQAIVMPTIACTQPPVMVASRNERLVVSILHKIHVLCYLVASRKRLADNSSQRLT